MDRREPGRVASHESIEADGWCLDGPHQPDVGLGARTEQLDRGEGGGHAGHEDDDLSLIHI